ncbi:MAG: AIR synthase family protein [Ruminococcus sp.]|nr:AIR synthase family protein [Ruminococcus sp.]
MMRTGKISENVLTHSVLRRIKSKREEVVCGAGIGTDCAVLAFGEDKETVLSTDTVSAPADMVCIYAMHKAMNNVAAAGAEPVGIMLSMMLPEDTEESILQEMMQQAEDICARYHIQLIGGHTESSAMLAVPMLTATCVGQREKEQIQEKRYIKPGQDVVISKWVGLEGTIRLAREHREELLGRYPAGMIEEAVAFERLLSIVPEAATAVKSGACGIHDGSQGGIFAALWEMAHGADVGLEIDLRKLPIRQETIEICEFFDLNPYELLSGGSLLMTTEDGNGLVLALEKEGIPATVVGKTTAGNDRVLWNEEEKRFLELPKADQIYQLKHDK